MIQDNVDVSIFTYNILQSTCHHIGSVCFEMYHVKLVRWARPEIDDVEWVSKFVSMLIQPRGATLPGNRRLSLSSRSVEDVVSAFWRSGVGCGGFVFTLVSLTWSFRPQLVAVPLERGSADTAAEVDVWAFPPGTELCIHPSIHHFLLSIVIILLEIHPLALVVCATRRSCHNIV